MKVLQRRPSPATVIALVALFVALGGSAIALKGKNSVRNDDVQNLRWTALELRNGWIARPLEVHYRPSVALDAQGMAHLRGAVQQVSGSDNVAFVLPKRFRPERALDVPIRGSNVSVAGIQISVDGLARIQGAQVQDEASLNGVSFWAGGN